jgi:6-pyruvoyltetrahydropterin/6-carboxytetrahydropterin synthase
MKAHLNRRYSFPASHRLHCAELSDAANQAAYGKCNNPYGHGHNYTLEVTVSGRVDPRTGMVCDLSELDSFVQQRVLSVFDHANLNTLPQFQSIVPTSENLGLEIHRIFTQSFRAAKLERIRLEETSKNSFEFVGDGKGRTTA